MLKFILIIFSALLLCVTNVCAARDPISWSQAGAIPAQTKLGSHYIQVFRFKSNLPFVMPTPLRITKTASSNEFTFSDTCSNKRLRPHQECRVSIGLTPRYAGAKTANVTMHYGKTSVPMPAIKTTTQSTPISNNWVGIIGVDYNPNHYVSGSAFNGHDVFFTGTANSNAVTNTYMEMAQLKAAGFTAVRSYQTVEYAWIDIIQQASALGLKVIYEAVIPQNGSNADITSAVSVLNNVIAAVGTSVFQNTVILVFAGHENYSNTDINYLVSAVTQLQAALTAQSLTTPVSSALVSGDLVTPGSPSDMQKLINSYSASAPLGFDPYPFQWGVTPPNLAVSSTALTNSIAWDYAQVQQQSFYKSPRPILMAETGWATEGTGQYAGYYCYTQSDCAPSIGNAATYLTALYQFVKTTTNNSGAFVFEAYDEPAKDPVNPTDAENHYGMFDSNCNLKNNNTNLLPNTNYSPTTNFGCQGYTSGALLVVVGDQPGNETNQPPFIVQVTQTNPTTSQSANFTATIPNRNRTNPNVYPWPQYLIFNGAAVTITGVTSGASCSFPVTVASGVLTVGAISCTNPSYLVTCTGSTCFLPWNNF